MKYALKIVGVVLIIAGFALIAYSYGLTPLQTVLTRQVVDVDGNPIEGAELKITCDVPKLGYCPFDGTSGSDGYVNIPMEGTPIMWVCRKTGYYDASGEDSPPMKIILTAVTDEPPIDDDDDIGPPIPPEFKTLWPELIGVILIILGVILTLL